MRRLQVAAAGFAAWVAVAALGASRYGVHDKILRARAIVLVDDQGRERILIGAPIPAAANRVRTDLDRAAAAWGGRFPPGFLDHYKRYRHDMNGLLILDEDGSDRIAVGDPVPDPNVGRRITPSSGIAFNDGEGYERGGFGLNEVDGVQRIVLGLDSAGGTEGATLALLDGGHVGLSVRDANGLAFFGSSVAPPSRCPPTSPRARAGTGRSTTRGS